MIRRGNRLVFANSFQTANLSSALACLHQTETAGFKDVILDFGPCGGALPAPMISLCCRVLDMRRNDIDFELVLPQNAALSKLFTNSNWAHLLSPDQYPASHFRGFSVLPATHFEDGAAQNAAVNKIIDGLLGIIPNLDRKGLAALEWSIAEITDNVLVHSQSPVGGIVQLSVYQQSARRIEYVVVDAGVGIPATLRRTHTMWTSDEQALEQSIREGVTRDASLGQGNGLYGSYEVCSKSQGIFHLQSGYAKLAFTGASGLRLSGEAVPFKGTLVDAQINLSDPKLLGEALKFGNRVYIPLADFVETRYEVEGSENIAFELIKETPSFRSRLAGTPVRTKLLNLLSMFHDRRITINFEGLALVSSSFADEVFGKLFIELGPVTFSRRLEFRNLSPTVQQLIDKAIEQRVASSYRSAKTDSAQN